ncbi:MAG: D-aminoacylase [Alphaproteobacteria bacterium]
MTDETAPPARCDLAISGATVIDGTGAPGVAADVAVTAERIVGVGDLAGTVAMREIEASGLVLAPGFIDVHTHDDRALLATPEMAMKVSQGVTTVVVGNCGVSLSPLIPVGAPPPPLDLLGEADDYRFPTVAEYARALERSPPATNAGVLVGHSTLRVGAMADLGRAASEAEIAAMRERLAEGMAAGAIGFSSGLFYRPSAAASTDETAALAEVAGAAGGLYTAHIRDEADRVAEALEEAFEIGRRARAQVVISHHKVSGTRNFGRTVETLALFERARASQPIGLDVYPYVAASTVLDPALLRDATRTLVTWSKARPDLAGRELSEIAELLGCDEGEAAARLQPAGAVYFLMDEADVRRVLSNSHAMIGSDGLPHDIHPHPRLWGTFPRVLGHYARELGLFPLEEAVRRMTGLSAQVFGFADRGTVRPGAFADLVLFDAGAVRDEATFDEPLRAAAGIELVMVNGETVWQGGESSGARPGRVLRRQN